MTINQLQLFIIFLVNGILIGVLFDIFRIIRKTFSHKDFVIYVQDTLFWIFTGIILIYSTFIFNDGQFRIFMLVGTIIGFLIYLYTLSKSFIKINIKIISVLKKITKKIIDLILIPIKFIVLTIRKIFLKPCTFLVINMKKTLKNIKMSKKEKNNKKEKIKEGF